MEIEPLDLGDIEKEVYNKIKKHIKKNYKPGDFVDEWIEIFENFEAMDSELGVIEFIISEIKQRIKSACLFYLRYKDNPELLIREHEEYEPEIMAKFFVFDILKYNEWLFELAFNDVLRGDA